MGNGSVVNVGKAFCNGVSVGGDLFSGLFVLVTPFSFSVWLLFGVCGGGGGFVLLSGFSHGR